ncbi:hypothetical protein [Rhizobium sp. YTU87027]|uniref:hypothetical protein n=1 Tax=Rhizobium sp. YTU87027 TaxID=3417741 RepID=UPI003D695043
MSLKTYREEQLKIIAQIEADLEFTATHGFRIFHRGPDGVEVDKTEAHVERSKHHLEVMKRALEITDANIAKSGE